MNRPTRAVARSSRAMIATPHAQATAAGLEVLRTGGSAVDAAIAANAVLAVVYPASCGIGGDALWMVYDAAQRRTIAYNGSGRTPRAASLDALAELPERGALAVTVPGAVRSWEEVGRAHGRRGLDALLAPAERYAREGFVVTDVVAAYCALNARLLAREEEAARLFLPGGAPPRPGDLLRNVDLAETLAAIRRGGADAFYTGAIGERLAGALRRRGSAMTVEDLAAHRTEPVEPVRLAWNGGVLVAHPPNSQGGALLMASGILAEDPPVGEAAWAHVAIEAMKTALGWRDANCADVPSARDALLARLTPEALRAARHAIDDRARTRVGAGDRGDTIAVVAVDEDGNAVTLIESLYMNFGSGVVAEGTGVVFHNRGACFALDPSEANVFAGGKRPMHTLSPAMFLTDERPAVVFGTMGGDGQPQIQLQFLHHHLERGFDVQRALDEPRWITGRSSIPGRPTLDAGDGVVVESRIDPALLQALRYRGHEVHPIGAWDNAMGHAHAIAIDHERGTLAGGSDPRADSLALGL